LTPTTNTVPATTADADHHHQWWIFLSLAQTASVLTLYEISYLFMFPFLFHCSCVGVFQIWHSGIVFTPHALVMGVVFLANLVIFITRITENGLQ
jgi:nitrate reductase gamma subunit